MSQANVELSDITLAPSGDIWATSQQDLTYTSALRKITNAVPVPPVDPPAPPVDPPGPPNPPTPVDPAPQPAVKPLQPTRILDTRSGADQIGYSGAKPTVGSIVALQVAGRGGVPSTGAAAVTMNVTLTEASGPGFVTVARRHAATAVVDPQRRDLGQHRRLPRHRPIGR